MSKFLEISPIIMILPLISLVLGGFGAAFQAISTQKPSKTKDMRGKIMIIEDISRNFDMVQEKKIK